MKPETFKQSEETVPKICEALGRYRLNLTYRRLSILVQCTLEN